MTMMDEMPVEFWLEYEARKKEYKKTYPSIGEYAKGIAKILKELDSKWLREVKQ